MICNGADITNTTCYFSKQEWHKLVKSIDRKNLINNCPNRKREQKKPRIAKDAKCRSIFLVDTFTTVMTKDDMTSQLSIRVINGAMHGQGKYTPTIQKVNRIPQYKSSVCTIAASIPSNPKYYLIYVATLIDMHVVLSSQRPEQTVPWWVDWEMYHQEIQQERNGKIMN